MRIQMTPSQRLAATLIVLAVVSRLLPHPWNVSPMAGIALFGMVAFGNRMTAIGVAVSAWFMSDLLVNVLIQPSFVEGLSYFWGGTALGVYLGLAWMLWMGSTLAGSQATGIRVMGFSLASSLGFFVISNTLVWASSGFYPMNLAGLGLALTAGIPFYQAGDVSSSFFLNQVVGDLLYTGALFGAHSAARRWVPYFA
jgi:hypothetical protein